MSSILHQKLEGHRILEGEYAKDGAKHLMNGDHELAEINLLDAARHRQLANELADTIDIMLGLSAYREEGSR